HPPRRLLDRLALLRVHVAEDERGLGQPREETERPEVRNHLHVAVAALPGRELEAREGFHLHVDGEEIDAGVRAFVGDVIEEVAPDDALAHQAAERVGKDGEDRVDLALSDQLFELLERETARHDADSSARQPPVSSSRRAPHATREQPARADRLVLLRLGELRVPHDGGDGVPRALADDRDQGRRRRGRVRLPARHQGPRRVVLPVRGVAVGAGPGPAAPLLGAVADYSHRKKEMLALFAYVGAGATLGLWIITGTSYLPGARLSLITNAGVGPPVVLYDACLPEIAAPDRRNAL